VQNTISWNKESINRWRLVVQAYEVYTAAPNFNIIIALCSLHTKVCVNTHSLSRKRLITCSQVTPELWVSRMELLCHPSVAMTPRSGLTSLQVQPYNKVTSLGQPWRWKQQPLRHVATYVTSTLRHTESTFHSALQMIYNGSGFNTDPYMAPHSSIHLAVCLTTGPKPLPNRALHIVRSRASSFRCEYPLPSLRSTSSFLRLLPHLPVISNPPFIFPSITCCRRQFLRKMWPIKLAFRLLTLCRMYIILFCYPSK
jgi:hypothetical protein